MHKLIVFIFTGAWIGLSEFVRNELLFKSYWVEHYQKMGIEFPSAMINNVFWGIWSFLLSGITLFLSKKLKTIESALVLWTMAFLMMWIVIGNLGVLPGKLLFFAFPLSALEVLVALIICKKFPDFSKNI